MLLVTDSLSAIHLLCRWNRNTDFAPYVKASTCYDLVLRILLILQARKLAGGATCFLFTRSHHGEFYNGAADRAAAAVADHAMQPDPLHFGLQLGTRSTTIIHGEGYSIPDPTSYTPWSKSLQKRWSASVRQRLVAQAEQNPTRVAQFLLRKHMGRRHLGTTLAKLNSWNTRTYYRAITYQLPTQTRLVQWGKAACHLCPLCGTQPETLSHTLTRCPALHDAITKAHDSALQPIQQILSQALSSYDCHWAVASGTLFPALASMNAAHRAALDPLFARPTTALERLVPDGILISRDPEDPHIVLLEFARTSDDTLHFSGLRRATKELKYLSLQRALHHLYPQATIDFCPLIIGSRASLPEMEWRDALKCFPRDQLTPPVLTALFKTAVTGAVFALTYIWRARQAALSNRRGVPPPPPDAP